MREIKFRAYGIGLKEPRMFSAEELGIDQMTLSADGRGFVNIAPTLAGSVFYGDKMIPLQYTGLCDRNGKEIYEGDIVKWTTLISHIEYHSSIQFEEREGCWILWDGNPDKEQHRLASGAASHCEVIGNIYETPEKFHTLPNLEKELKSE